MVRESEPERFKVRGISIGRVQGHGRKYVNKSLSSSSYKQEVNLVTILRKQVYSYTLVKDIIVHKVKNHMDMKWQVN